MTRPIDPGRLSERDCCVVTDFLRRSPATETHERLRNSPNAQMRLLLAQYGTDEDRRLLRADCYYGVRAAVAYYGKAADWEALKDDDDGHVRFNAAFWTGKVGRLALRTDPDWLNQLMLAKFGDRQDRTYLREHSHNLHVLEAVAQYGTHRDRDALVSCPAPEVRETVAIYGLPRHRRKLRNDPSWVVQVAVAEYGSAADRRALRRAQDWRARRAVARYGNNADRAYLLGDRVRAVRDTAEEYAAGWS